MGQKLEGIQLELYRRTDEILHYVWDPIGVGGVPEARNEYYSYLPRVFALLNEGASTKSISAYLKTVSEGHMGLSNSTFCTQRADQAAKRLIEWRKHLNS